MLRRTLPQAAERCASSRSFYPQINQSSTQNPSFDSSHPLVLVLSCRKALRDPPTRKRAPSITTGRKKDVEQNVIDLIAEALVIAEGTVKSHVSNILSKLHLAHRTQAALYALKRKLVPLNDPHVEEDQKTPLPGRHALGRPDTAQGLEDL